MPTVLSHCAFSHFGQEAKRKLSLVTLIASVDRGTEGAGVLFHCDPSHLGQETQHMVLSSSCAGADGSVVGDDAPAQCAVGNSNHYNPCQLPLTILLTGADRGVEGNVVLLHCATRHSRPRAQGCVQLIVLRSDMLPEDHR